MVTFDKRHLKLHLVKNHDNSTEHIPTYSPIQNGSESDKKHSALREWLSWSSFKSDLLAWSSPDGKTSLAYCSAHVNISLDKVKFWKPATLGGSVLGAFILVSIGIIIVLEILIRTSSLEGNDGGIVFANSKEAIPMTTIFW